MKTYYLSQRFTTLSAKTSADDNSPILKNSADPSFDSAKASDTSAVSARPPKIVKTIVDALAEGLKQNLLGADVNMEFLTLTVRSFALTSFKAVKHFVKPLTNKHPASAQRHQLNQPSY